MTSNIVNEFVQLTAYENIPFQENYIYPEPWVCNSSVQEVSRLFENWEPSVQTLLSVATDVSRWVIHETIPLPTFARDKVVLIGDAAHAMTPHTGSGGGQAIEDALVLSHLLNHPQTNISTLAEALNVFDQVRRPAAQQIAHWSKECGLMFSFLLEEKKNTPLEDLGEEFIQRTEWLKDEDWLQKVLDQVDALFASQVRGTLP